MVKTLPPCYNIHMAAWENHLSAYKTKGGAKAVKLLKKHVGWFLTRTARDRLDSSSAHAAYFLIISFLPFVAFLLTLMQQIHFIL